jgi:hypothetical protein
VAHAWVAGSVLATTALGLLLWPLRDAGAALGALLEAIEADAGQAPAVQAPSRVNGVQAATAGDDG